MIPKVYDGFDGVEWLLKADPSISYLGDSAHRQAFWASIVVLSLLVVVIPLYIIVFSSDEVTRLQTRYNNLEPVCNELDRHLRLEQADEKITREQLRKITNGIMANEGLFMLVPVESGHRFRSLSRTMSKEIPDPDLDALVSTSPCQLTYDRCCALQAALSSRCVADATADVKIVKFL